MSRMNLLDKIDHDLASASRNLQVALSLLAGSDISLATELLQAGVEQLEDFRKFYQNLDLENKQSIDAHK